jgi:plasmid stabilization system protein ParE
MKKFNIVVSIDAFEDIQDLYYFIVSEYNSPLTAKRYVDGLYQTIKSLQITAESYSIRADLSLYGNFVRRINYKKMAIIYTVHGNSVYIHRVIAASMLTGI